MGWVAGGRVADEVTGLEAGPESELERERRGNTAASPSWFTSADISMESDGRVVLRLIEIVIGLSPGHGMPSRAASPGRC
jgi:hypothetical protein